MYYYCTLPHRSGRSLLSCYSAAILASKSLTHGGRRYLRKPAYIVKSFAFLFRSSIMCRRVPSLLLYCELASLDLCSSQLRPVHIMRFGMFLVMVSGNAAYLPAYWRMIFESPCASRGSIWRLAMTCIVSIHWKNWTGIDNVHPVHLSSSEPLPYSSPRSFLAEHGTFPY